MYSCRLQHLIAWSFSPSNSYSKVFLETLTCLNFWSSWARMVYHYICCPMCLSSALTTCISSKFCTLKRTLYPQNETPPTPLLVNLMWTSVLKGLCEWLQLLFSPFWPAYMLPPYSGYSCQWEWFMPVSHSNTGLETHLNPKDRTVRFPHLKHNKICLVSYKMNLLVFVQKVLSRTDAFLGLWTVRFSNVSLNYFKCIIATWL